MILDRRITVCDQCLQASCWLGIFMCQESKFAGTCEKTVRELRALGRESPDYWFKSVDTGAVNQHDMANYQESILGLDSLLRT
jgi:hypothetical protein